MDMKDRRFGIVSDEPTEDMYMTLNFNIGNTGVERDSNGVTLTQSLIKVHIDTKLLEMLTVKEE